MSLVQSFVDPDYDGVVHQVEEEEVEQHCFADLGSWFLYSRIGWGVSDNWMSADPREQFIDVSESLTSKGVAHPQDDDDHSGCSHYGSIDVESSNNRDDKEAKCNLEQQVYFHPKTNLKIHMRDKNTRWFDIQAIITQEYSSRIIQNLISNKIIKIKEQRPYSAGLSQHNSIIGVTQLIPLIPVHKHGDIIPPEIDHVLIIICIAFILYYYALCCACCGFVWQKGL